MRSLEVNAKCPSLTLPARCFWVGDVTLGSGMAGGGLLCETKEYRRGQDSLRLFGVSCSYRHPDVQSHVWATLSSSGSVADSANIIL